MKEVKVVTEKKPAAFWKRFLAYLVDLLLINLVVILPFRPQLEKYSNYTILLSPTGNSSLIFITFIIIILSLFYFISLEYKLHQTFGKMLLNLYVEGKPYTLNQIILRNLTKPFPILVVIDTAYMFFKRSHQRLFERFSNTDVVELTWKIK